FFRSGFFRRGFFRFGRRFLRGGRFALRRFLLHRGFLLFRRRRFAAQQFHLCHLELGQLRTVPGAAAVALPPLVFDGLDLGPAQVLSNGRLDLDLLQLGARDHFFVAEEDGPQRDLVPFLGVEAIDE